MRTDRAGLEEFERKETWTCEPGIRSWGWVESKEMKDRELGRARARIKADDEPQSDGIRAEKMCGNA